METTELSPDVPTCAIQTIHRGSQRDTFLAGALMVFGGMLGIAKGFKKVFMAGAAMCTVGEALAVVNEAVMEKDYYLF